VNPLKPPAIIVKIEKGKADKTEFRFTDSFQIGRGRESEIRIMDDIVSRPHAEVRFEGGRWWAYDLNSTNGIFVDGEKVDQVTLANNTRIILGQFGPVLSFYIEDADHADKTRVVHRSIEQYANRYFGDPDEDTIGEHTMMVRRAFKKIQQKQKKKYGAIIAVFALLSLLAGTYAVYKHRQVMQQKALAEDIFYSMKRLELEIADTMKELKLKKDAESQKLVENYKLQQKELEEKYDQFVDTLDVYGKGISEKERLILRVARTFGECEINMPKGFSKEVMSYIKKWKTTTKLEEAIARAKRKGYIPKIVEIMKSNDLPPQFFYLGLQESLFDINACGPKTRFGIAKGIWQFIPPTAVRYGLNLGPLVDLKKPDPKDERQQFEPSTEAAAKYLRDIYDTEAQASGLLVMASYNWGEQRMIDLIRKMPENPRERNFWRILKNYKEQIPKQTYDYVFYIVSATVIGENPRLFGFNFNNPLASAISKEPTG
jgi:membrane-bound lytic murein transglycosylase D